MLPVVQDATLRMVHTATAFQCAYEFGSNIEYVFPYSYELGSTIGVSCWWSTVGGHCCCCGGLVTAKLQAVLLLQCLAADGVRQLVLALCMTSLITLLCMHCAAHLRVACIVNFMYTEFWYCWV